MAELFTSSEVKEKFSRVLTNYVRKMGMPYVAAPEDIDLDKLRAFRKYFRGDPGIIKQMLGFEHVEFGDSIIGFSDAGMLISDRGIFWSSAGSLDKRGRFYLLWPELVLLEQSEKIRPDGKPSPGTWEGRRIGLFIGYLVAVVMLAATKLAGWIMLAVVVALHLWMRWARKNGTLTFGHEEVCWFAGDPKKAWVAFDIIERGMALYKKAAA